MSEIQNSKSTGHETVTNGYVGVIKPTQNEKIKSSKHGFWNGVSIFLSILFGVIFLGILLPFMIAELFHANDFILAAGGLVGVVFGGYLGWTWRHKLAGFIMAILMALVILAPFAVFSYDKVYGYYARNHWITYISTSGHFSMKVLHKWQTDDCTFGSEFLGAFIGVTDDNNYGVMSVGDNGVGCDTNNPTAINISWDISSNPPNGVNNYESEGYSQTNDQGVNVNNFSGEEITLTQKGDPNITVYTFVVSSTGDTYEFDYQTAPKNDITLAQFKTMIHSLEFN